MLLVLFCTTTATKPHQMFFFDFFFDKYQKLNDLNSKNRRLFLYPDPPKALMYGPHLCVCVQGMMLIPGGKRRFPVWITGPSLDGRVKTPFRVRTQFQDSCGLSRAPDPLVQHSPDLTSKRKILNSSHCVVK